MFRHRYLLLVSLTLTIAKPAGVVVSAELYRTTANTFGRRGTRAGGPRSIARRGGEPC